MIVLLTSQARAEFDQAIGYIALRNPPAVRTVGLAIQSALDSLATFPSRGRQTMFSGLRELVVRRTPYIIVYSVGSEHVEVIRIRHASQDPSP